MSDDLAAESDDVEWTLDQVSSARAEALSNLDGVRATVWPDVVMAMPDGSEWVSSAYGAFESFDASTGTYRFLQRDEFGGMFAQEVTGRPGSLEDWTVAWRSSDPFAPLGVGVAGAVPSVSITDREGRASWEITWSDGGDVVSREVVDMKTGLLVESTERRWWSLGDVQPIDSLPTKFPGAFPDDVEVNREVSNPDALRPVTLDEAARSFTPGLIIPSNLPADVSVFLYDPAVGREDSPREEVTFLIRDGFDTTRIVVSKFLPYDEVTITSGDIECHDFDQDQVCDYRVNPVDAVGGGVLAGRDLTLVDGVLTVYDAGRIVEISTVDPQRSLELAESFVATEVFPD